MQEKKDRNLEITKKSLEGKTQFQLAIKYGLHPNRIYQIIKNTKLKYKLE